MPVSEAVSTPVSALTIENLGAGNHCPGSIAYCAGDGAARALAPCKGWQQHCQCPHCEQADLRLLVSSHCSLPLLKLASRARAAPPRDPSRTAIRRFDCWCRRPALNGPFINPARNPKKSRRPMSTTAEKPRFPSADAPGAQPSRARYRRDKVIARRSHAFASCRCPDAEAFG